MSQSGLMTCLTASASVNKRSSRKPKAAENLRLRYGDFDVIGARLLIKLKCINPLFKSRI